MGLSGVGLGCLGAVMAQQRFFAKSCSRLRAVHWSGHRKTTFSRNPALAWAPCTFSDHLLSSLVTFFENSALASTPCTFRLHFKLSWGCLGLSWPPRGLSWGLLGLILGCLGVTLGQDTFFRKSCSRLGAAHISAHRKMTFSEIELWP